MIDAATIRKDFPLLERRYGDTPLVYLDSAATTQKPNSVIDAISTYYRETNANVHRGAYRLADEATTAYESARTKVAGLINARSSSEVIFTRGTTAALNLLALRWADHLLSEGDRILLTLMEHHSNIVPWQLVAQRTGAELVYLDITPDFAIDLDRLDEVLDERVKIATVSGMSNVMGTIGPVDEITKAARAVGASVIVDGAQLVPHMPVDVQALDVDFLTFSAHKMLGPTGIGALWGRGELLDAMEPLEGGGEMITDVGLYESRWAPIPHKFEAGTPPIAQAVGFGAAVDYLVDLGMDDVRAHELDITAYALDRLAEVPDLTVYGPQDPARRGGAVSFELADIHAHDLATILDEEQGVAVRAGHHCAKPLMRHLEVPATARASFYVYTVPEDIDALVIGLMRAREIFGIA
ncbi:MAG: cysteine desulfurase [Acidimicrobiia bacterium]|nr:cysteine desulfurase [Acidimicrobiia bacterium]